MKHLVRSLKYFCKLCVICVAVMTLMIYTGMSSMTGADMMYILTQTIQGWILIGAALVLSALYPKFGFLTRNSRGDIKECRKDIVDAFSAMDYAIDNESESSITFRAKSSARRFIQLYEDEIKVSQDGPWIVLEGWSKGVVRVECLLESYIRQRK